MEDLYRTRRFEITYDNLVILQETSFGTIVQVIIFSHSNFLTLGDVIIVWVLIEKGTSPGKDKHL